jgi:Subunit ChlI of Mg-chelatase
MAIAVGVLLYNGMPPPGAAESMLMVGELSLDGAVRHARGVLPMAATRSGITVLSAHPNSEFGQTYYLSPELNGFWHIGAFRPALQKYSCTTRDHAPFFSHAGFHSQALWLETIAHPNASIGRFLLGALDNQITDLHIHSITDHAGIDDKPCAAFNIS